MKIKYEYILAILVAVSLLLRISCIDCYNFSFGGDESDYARTAVRITNSCLIISTYAMPAGIAYLQATSFLLLGPSEFSARLVSVVFSVFSAVILSFIVKMLFGKKKALISAVLLLFTPFLMLESRVANTDSVLLFFIMLFLYFMFLFSIEKKQWQFYAIWLVFGLGVNIKHAMYLMIPVLVAFFWVNKESLRQEITTKRIIVALIIIGLFSVPIALMNIGSIMLGREAFLFSHASGANFMPLRSVFFYVNGVLDANSLPVMIFFLVASVYALWKKPDKTVIFLTIYILIFAIFFGSAANAYTRYLLPIMPALCIFGAIFLDDMKKYGYIPAVMLVIIGSLYFMNTIQGTSYFSSAHYSSLRERTGWHELSNFLMDNTNESDVIIGSQPMIEFYAGRKGLNIDENTIKKPPVDAKYIVKEQGHMDEFGSYIDQHFPLLMEMGRFKIYTINSTERSEPIKILPLCVNYYIDHFLLNKTTE